MSNLKKTTVCARCRMPKASQKLVFDFRDSPCYAALGTRNPVYVVNLCASCAAGYEPIVVFDPRGSATILGWDKKVKRRALR